MIFNRDEWKKMWLANYRGETDESKELEKFMKANYKKHQYIPWATMVRLLNLLDPDATLEVVQPTGIDGLVTSSDGRLYNTDKKVNGDKVVSTDTAVTYTSHFVIVRCVFMGKEFIEYYPVQDNKYDSPSYYDSNMINKSIQRAKAKVISTATGLAFRLYEDGDLQFEDDTKQDKDKVVTVKEDKKVVEPTVTKPVVVEVAKEVVDTKISDDINGDYSDDIKSIVKTLRTRNKDDVTKILQSINGEMVKNYKFTISLDDSEKDMLDKVSKIKNAEMFNKVINARLDSMVAK